MNELVNFKNEDFGEIRTMLVDGVPYFVGRDVALALGYAKPRNVQFCNMLIMRMP